MKAIGIRDFTKAEGISLYTYRYQGMDIIIHQYAPSNPSMEPNYELFIEQDHEVLDYWPALSFIAAKTLALSIVNS